MDVGMKQNMKTLILNHLTINGEIQDELSHGCIRTTVITFLPQLSKFSGTKRNPEIYLELERDMDERFWYHNIPKDERLSHALNQLYGWVYAW